MNKTDELSIEIAKQKAEEMVITKELDVSKKHFIEYVKENLNDINEMEISNYNKPIHYHKPFKLKVKEFFNKISKVLGI